MQLRIRSRALALSGGARRFVDRRIRLALGRHVAAIDRAEVLLFATEPGARGASGGERSCRIFVEPKQGPSFAIEHDAADVCLAVAVAARRLQQRLDRQRATRGLPAFTDGRGRDRFGDHR